MAEENVRFGILGCARIAVKVSRAIRLTPNATLYAVGSRSLEKAEKFAGENLLPPSVRVYGSYDAVLDDPDVDAVYVPLPTSLHVKWAVLAARKKKHVLLEKPVALNVKDLDIILEECESNGVQFMDGTMWLHHPRTAKMREFLSDPQRFGQLKAVHSVFSYFGGDDFLKNSISTKAELEGLGALGNAGWYPIGAILWATDYQMPTTVTALRNPDVNQAGVILACGASLYWEDGRLATFYCSFKANLTMDFTALGTIGYLRVHDFVVPFQENDAAFYVSANSKFIQPSLGCDLCDPVPSECNVTTQIPQEALMLKDFSTLVSGIKWNGSAPEKKWPVISRKTQVVMDAVKASIERGFEVVEIGH